MTDGIFGNRAAFARTPAWHNLGRVYTDKVSAEQATVENGLNYNVVKLPLAGQVITPFGTQLVVVEDKVMIAREPVPDDNQYRYFGVASPEYGIIQNIDVARALDRLTDSWPVETVGALGKGETIFYTLDAGYVDVKGEQVHEYFLVTDTRNGGTSMKIAYTPVRVVCQNTLVTGLKLATITTSLEHTPGIEANFNFRVGLVDLMNKARNSTKATFEMLANVALGDNDLEFILDRAYPVPTKPKKADLFNQELDEADIATLGDLYTEASEAVQLWEYYCTRATSFREGAKTLFGQINDEYPSIANTPWAAYNAVVESADYRRGSDSVPVSALFGSRAQEKIRAFKAAMTVAENNS